MTTTSTPPGVTAGESLARTPTATAAATLAAESPTAPPTTLAYAATAVTADVTSSRHRAVPAAAGDDRTPLADGLARALRRSDADFGDLVHRAPASRRDRFATLGHLYALHTAPLAALGDRARHQHAPELAAVKTRLEADWLAELDSVSLPAGAAEDPVGAMRALATRNRLPAVYRWVARDASRSDLVRFLALEGGPDAGFDDLVALCQVGLSGSAKMELATNYWDEMGNGTPAEVHTTLYEQMVDALAIPAVPTGEQPEAGLERSALGGLLATNRWLQPEMLGALGMIELQAGPRCRLVLQAFERLEVPAAAYPFYAVHAEVDPRHGTDWLAKVIAPLAQHFPQWRARMVRGALWRHAVNAAFFDALADLLLPARERAA